MVDNDEVNVNYSWESGYEKTWEAINEDASGSITTSVQRLLHELRSNQRTSDGRPRRLGVIRHVYMILDVSAAMHESDLKPSRIACVVEMLKRFIRCFSRMNPISQLGLISTCDGLSKIECHLTGDTAAILSALIACYDHYNVTESVSGTPSLVNASMMALNQLKHFPKHSSREILYIAGSMSTSDPTSVHKAISDLKTNIIQCSAISLAAEVHIQSLMCQQTGGIYNVILNEEHLKDSLMRHTQPVLSCTIDPGYMVLGFPVKQPRISGRYFCLTHYKKQDDLNGDIYPETCTASYICPRCSACYCSLPVECSQCSLNLVSGTELARSYHYLFPLAAFDEVRLVDKCAGCFENVRDNQETIGYKCRSCSYVFCSSCDEKLHSIVFTCPGCCEFQVADADADGDCDGPSVGHSDGDDGGGS